MSQRITSAGCCGLYNPVLKRRKAAGRRLDYHKPKHHYRWCCRQCRDACPRRKQGCHQTAAPENGARAEPEPDRKRNCFECERKRKRF